MATDFSVFTAITDQYNRCSGNQLRDHIYGRQLAKLDEAAAFHASIQTPEELEAYNRTVRREFVAQLGGLPDMSLPLDAVVTNVLETEEYTLESILYRSTAHTWVSGSLYLPKGIAYPAPAVLFVCGHWPEGRLAEEYRMVCRTLVRAGLIVFAIDPIGQGERSNFYDPETGEYRILRTVPDHDGCGIPSIANGEFIERWFLCDQMKAVDYMLTRPEIDPARIGITGNSGGGLQSVSMMVADERIAAAAPGTYVTTRRDWLYTDCAMDAEQIWPGCDDYHFEHLNMLMAFAPKPAALLAVRWDFFPIDGTRKTFADAKRFYALYGKEENIRMYEDDSWHRYTPKLAVNAAEFFSEVFYGEKRTVNNDDLQQAAGEAVFATETGWVAGDVADAWTLPQLVKEKAAALCAARLALPKAERLARARRWLQPLVDRERCSTPLSPRISDPSHIQYADGYVGTRHSWWIQQRLFGIGVLIRKKELEHVKGVPTVIAVWDDGTKAITAHEDWIRSRCDAGKQVLVLDIPGVGSNKQNDFSDFYGYRSYYGTLYRLCCDLLYMGDSMPALCIHSVLQSLPLLESFWGVCAADVSVYCDGKDGVYGVAAAFLKDLAVECGPDLLRSVEDFYIRPDVPPYEDAMCYMLPGMLEYFDYRDLLE